MCQAALRTRRAVPPSDNLLADRHSAYGPGTPVLRLATPFWRWDITMKAELRHRLQTPANRGRQTTGQNLAIGKTLPKLGPCDKTWRLT